jgi:two-component system, chemotaxis family, chemotaxis protein CheY
MYGIALSAAGFAIEEAEDGRDALVKSFASLPSFIITETYLSFVNGVQLCGLLRRDEKTRRACVIVLSSDGDPEQLGRAWAAGADSVFVKPCFPETVVQEIQRLGAQSLDHANGTKANNVSASGRSATRMHQRFETTTPPLPPPSLCCPSCGGMLRYERSHVGGVSARHREQWDHFVCASCGAFEYRQRTGKLRRVEVPKPPVLRD